MPLASQNMDIVELDRHWTENPPTKEYGRSDYDRRHRFNLIGTYRFRRGFKAGTVVNLNSGIPFNITTGLLKNGDLVPTATDPAYG